eukprot:scaffold46253_cov445-Skeletonema_marinoi.AAC.1
MPTSTAPLPSVGSHPPNINITLHQQHQPKLHQQQQQHLLQPKLHTVLVVVAAAVGGVWGLGWRRIQQPRATTTCQPIIDLTRLSLSVFSAAFLVGVDHNNNQPIIDHTRSSL